MAMTKGLMQVAGTIAAAGLLLTGCGSGGGEAGADASESFTLQLSSFFPEEHPMGTFTEEWAADVSEATGGRAEIEVFPSGSLTSAGECYQGVVDGISDMCHTALAYTPGRFPLMEVVDIPGWTGSGTVTSQVANRLYQEVEPEGLSDTEMMFLHAHPPGNLMMADEPVTSMDELRGKKIRTTGLSVGIVESLGAQAVTMPLPEVYDPLMRGVVDGTLGAVNGLKYYRHSEVTQHTTVAPSVGYVTAMMVVMNKDVWSKFTADEQERIQAINEDYSLKAGQLWDEMSREGVEVGKEAGHEFHHLSAEEEERWFATGVQPVLDAYISGSEDKGFDGAAIWEQRQDLEEELLEEFPPFTLPGTE